MCCCPHPHPQPPTRPTTRNPNPHPPTTARQRNRKQQLHNTSRQPPLRMLPLTHTIRTCFVGLLSPPPLRRLSGSLSKDSGDDNASPHSEYCRVPDAPSLLTCGGSNHVTRMQDECMREAFSDVRPDLLSAGRPNMRSSTSTLQARADVNKSLTGRRTGSCSCRRLLPLLPAASTASCFFSLPPSADGLTRVFRAAGFNGESS